MQEFLRVMGMVIKTFPQGEYDRRITLLTREQGKITAFVKGARRQGSRFSASTDLFSFGEFDLYVGKDAYTVQNAEISNFFEFLRKDMNAAFYGMYFLEMSDYYAREGNDEALNLLLLYRALQGLKSEVLNNDVVRYLFELKLFIIEGELIPIERAGEFNEGVYTLMQYLYECSIEDLYKYPVDDKLRDEIKTLCDYERKHLVDRKLNSLEMLDIASD